AVDREIKETVGRTPYELVCHQLIIEQSLAPPTIEPLFSRNSREPLPGSRHIRIGWTSIQAIRLYLPAQEPGKVRPSAGLEIQDPCFRLDGTMPTTRSVAVGLC